MASAIPQVRAVIAAVPRRPLEVPVVSSHDGEVVDESTLRDHLVRQLTHPVRGARVLARLGHLGVTDVVLLGPGKVLERHLAVAMPAVPVHRTERAVDLRAAAQVGSSVRFPERYDP